MITILLISNEKETLSNIESYLEQSNRAEIVRAKSGEEALNILSAKAIDLVVADENLQDMSGLEFIKKMVRISPMSNCAVVSSLSSNDFHEASEGLGVLMQLPERPDENHGEMLFHKLSNVLRLSVA